MKGHHKVITVLNVQLTAELTAINQYFLHARMFKNWGFQALNHSNYRKSIQDMKHADALIERVLFLDGLPNLQRLDKINIGEHPQEMLSSDKQMIEQQLVSLRHGIALCEHNQDFVSRQLLTAILDDEEQHLDWLETQFTLLQDMGVANYLQSQVGESS
ncbi:bacterioferritin [Shewanella sp. NIFS-20-20]|uniref:bacterioferritin n=1 Tax=Shewanella sp. NIFS-20-20 TaxID=2853806 RepID=UPI001C452732|nr:bacterioferritin [Shewanella sp. NIFS-20-20]